MNLDAAEWVQPHCETSAVAPQDGCSRVSGDGTHPAASCTINLHVLENLAEKYIQLVVFSAISAFSAVHCFFFGCGHAALYNS